MIDQDDTKISPNVLSVSDKEVKLWNNLSNWMYRLAIGGYCLDLNKKMDKKFNKAFFCGL